MGDLTLFEALAGGAFDHLNCQHIPGNLSKIFPTSQMSGCFRGGGGVGVMGNFWNCWFARDVTAAMLVVKNKSISLLWELNSIFM